jgi:hypothetical protein
MGETIGKSADFFNGGGLWRELGSGNRSNRDLSEWNAGEDGCALK